MHTPQFDLPPVGSGPDRRLPLLFQEGFGLGLARKTISYDPAGVETLEVPPLCFHFLPGREGRPRTAPLPGESGLGRPHRACPFDSEEFLAEREVLRVSRGSRSYHLAFNKYPVLPLHYLAIRPAYEPPETLPQRLFGAEEIEDMLRLASLLGSPYRLFFNSNRGSDGSRSGSSVNHWHFQIFPAKKSVAERAPLVTPSPDGVERTMIPGWPAHHRFYRSADGGALSRTLWADVSRVGARDIAYNLEVAAGEGGRVAAVLFPRAPVEDLLLAEGRTLPGDFGGFELSGAVVVPTREAFQWITAHPGQAVALVLDRLRQGTCPLP
jgi:hypothetical protein